jgi:bifunctional non-homologous end joining protein LigD
MLATAGSLPADDGSWAFEFKWDGIRAICYVERGEARFVSRNGNNLTSSFHSLQPHDSSLEGSDLVLDGEIVAFDERGIPSFQALQSRGHGPSAAVAYIIFDVLWLDGSSMMDKPYAERRAVLEDLALDRIASWSVAPSFAGPGSDVVAASGERGLEGVVAKRLDSRYIPGSRSPLWIKVKHVRSQEVVIGGFTQGGGSRSGSIGALLLGVADVSGLRYVGKVGSGFDSEELRSLGTALSKIPAKVSPFSEVLHLTGERRLGCSRCSSAKSALRSGPPPAGSGSPFGRASEATSRRRMSWRSEPEAVTPGFRIPRLT